MEPVEESSSTSGRKTFPASHATTVKVLSIATDLNKSVLVARVIRNKRSGVIMRNAFKI